MKTDPTPPTPEVLWGRYVEVLYDYEDAVAEHPPPDLEFGRGISRASQPGLLLLTDTAADDFVSSMTQAFDKADSFRPIVIEPAAAANGKYLAEHGYVASSGRVMRLQSAARTESRLNEFLVLSARAALPALEKMNYGTAADATQGRNLLPHLDDPQFECILALRNGKALGRVGLQLRGQTGLILDWYVDPQLRHQGLGMILLERALELAARSQLVDVFAAASEKDAEAAKLLEKTGFRTICEFRLWQPPAQ